MEKVHSIMMSMSVSRLACISPHVWEGIICVILRLAVLIQYRNVTDTQTDRQTDDDGILRLA